MSEEATYNIKEPLWSIEGFGIAAKNMGSSHTLITCSYRDKTRVKPYPHVYKADTLFMQAQPAMRAGRTKVYIASFDELPIYKGAK